MRRGCGYELSPFPTVSPDAFFFERIKFPQDEFLPRLASHRLIQIFVVDLLRFLVMTTQQEQSVRLSGAQREDSRAQLDAGLG